KAWSKIGLVELNANSQGRHFRIPHCSRQLSAVNMNSFTNAEFISVKLRSNGLSFHRFRPRIALFPVVGTGKIDVTCGLVSALWFPELWG
ncbi:hypothetical protein AVEN_173982-1, partial [Araneus ventricosus]